jgi:hypothetical protein
VATSGTEEPFSVGSGLHELEIAVLDAIGTTDGAAAIALDSFHFDNEGVTFFVNGKTTVVDGGRLGSERLGTDRAAGGFGVHYYRSCRTSLKSRQSICMSASEQMVCFFSCRSGRVNTCDIAGSQ